MTVITARLVSKLRMKTDAPIMECKKALIEANGDQIKAEELLRIKLGNKALKVSSRLTAEGVIAIHIVDKVGALVEVNCETDFITKNNEFINLANQIAKLIVEKNPADLKALSLLSLHNKIIEEKRIDLISRINENILIRRFKRFEATHRLVSYLHNTRIGVVVEFDGTDEKVGRDVAMHIAAMKPLALSSKQISADLINQERSIAQLKAIESGKASDIVIKIVNSAIKKYLKEVSLFDQTFIKNDKQSVGEMLKNTNTIVKSFYMFVVGEDIKI